MPEETPYKYQAFPAWRYDPKTGEGRVFNSAAEIPAGWSETNPRPDPHADPEPIAAKAAAPKAAAAAAPPPPPATAPADVPPPPPPATAPADVPPPPPPPGASEVDAAGTPFDAARHTGTKTKAGLWRMRVGVSRPEAEGVVKPIDL